MKTLTCLFVLFCFTGLTYSFAGPDLYSPANYYVFKAYTPPVTFSWSAHPTALRYHLQVARDADFTDIILDNLYVGSTSYSTTLYMVDGGEYYWRVQTYAYDWWNQANPYWSFWSATRKFTCDFYTVITGDASDGKSDGQIIISWKHLPAYINSIDVYRDGADKLTISQPGESAEYSDSRNLISGKMYNYQLDFKENSTIWRTISDFGFSRPNGTIKGVVKTGSVPGAGVGGVQISAFDTLNQLSAALNLDGNDYVNLSNNADLNIPRNITLETWVMSGNFAISTEQKFIAKATDGGIHQYGLGSEANTGRLVFYIGLGADNVHRVTSQNALINGQWQHVAGSFNGSVLKVYLNGQLEGEVNIGSRTMVSTAGILAIGRSGSHGSAYFTGSIDEVRLWNLTRTTEEIAGYRNIILKGNEYGLLGYWRFSAGSGTTAFDYAWGKGHHGVFSGDPTWNTSDKPAGLVYRTYTNNDGEYNISNIFYGSGQPVFRVMPEKTDHDFNPRQRHGFLSFSYPTWTVPDIIDISSFTIRGTITFANTSCGVPGVDIYLDGYPTMQKTDADGNYTVSVTEVGEHTITPYFYNHQFNPADYTINVQEDLSGYDFSDTTTAQLSGTFYGGAEKFPIGEASLLIEGPDNCLQQMTSTDSGVYHIRLPAMPTVHVTIAEVSPNLGAGYLNSSKTISLAEGDTSLDFTFYAKPEIVITGWPESECNFTIMEQGITYPLTIDIIEHYGENSCKSDSGLVRFYNSISDETLPLEVELDSTGRFPYTFRAGNPNFTTVGDRPYQKNLQIFVQTRAGDSEETRWALVTGYSPREQTFVTVSPELPLLILRDPPGDNSYSEMRQSIATSVTTSLGILTDASIGTYALAKAGVQFEAGFLGFSTETNIWGSVSSSIEIGASLLNQSEHQLYISSSTGFKTSDSEEITGGEGDVFVGAAFNILYAITDVLSVNERCDVETSKSIVYGVDSLKTTYLYTDKYIREFLIPDLQLLKDMSTEIEDIQKYKDQIEVWKQTLAFNDSLKKDAVKIEDPSFNFDYVSFSGDVTADYHTTVTQVRSRSVYFNMYLNASVATEAGLEIAGSGFQAGVQVRASLNIGKARSASITTTNEIGFHLHDNDNGDLFFVKILGDPVYGTPVYETIGGHSSNPWEEHTQKRDKINLWSDSYVQTDLLPQQVAGYTLNISNLSESFESRTYEALVLNETNPDGAEIKIAGVPVIVPIPLNFEANETKNIIMTIERGPFAYDYENIQVVVRAPNDHNTADTAAYSAHFQSPCSPITMSQPAEGWVVNRNSHDSLRIAISSYDKTKMSGIYVQYSQKGRNAWHNGLHVNVNDLPDNDAILYWQTDSLTDNLYDLRLAVQWNQDIAYTGSISGRIDRLPPQLFGEPQPADGILARGDEISITFNEDIEANSVTADKVSLLNKDGGTAVSCKYVLMKNKIIITPDVADTELENKTLQATVRGISDGFGNTMESGISWSFYINRNPVYWSEPLVEKTVLHNSTDSVWVKLYNVGSIAANVTINESPSWTELDFTTGTIPVNGTQNVIIRVLADQLTIGVHTDTIVAQTAQGAEPLVLKITVQAEPPSWQIDPDSFLYTMSVSAAVYIEDVPFSDQHDRLAAFVGDELRGMVEVQKVVPQDVYVAFLMVYSNQTEGERVSFRIWDASEGHIRSISEMYNFIPDTIYGTAASFKYLHVSDILLQQILLAATWNWISMGVESRDMSTENVLKHVAASDGDLIKGSSEYCQYLPGAGWVGNLDTMRIGAGFKIKRKSPGQLDFFGAPVPVADHPIDIVPGWNWIAYLPSQVLPVNDALSGYTASSGDLIKNKSDHASFAGSQWQGTLSQMEPGVGYMLNSANGGELIYPGSSGKCVTINKAVSARDFHLQAPTWSVNPNAFEHSMNITGNLAVDGTVNADANVLLAAFVDGQCRGIAKPIQVQKNWLYFLTVYAKQNDLISFKIWDAASDQIKNLSQTVIFSPDSLIGSPSRPSAWNTPVTAIAGKEQEMPTKYELAQNHPNPFNPTTTIKYALKYPGYVNLAVYDILGRVVRILVEEEQEAGYYEIGFNASEFASGTYFYRLQTDKFRDVKKMIIIK